MKPHPNEQPRRKRGKDRRAACGVALNPKANHDLAASLIRANQEEAQDEELRKELKLWEITLSDGIPAEE